MIKIMSIGVLKTMNINYKYINDEIVNITKKAERYLKKEYTVVVRNELTNIKVDVLESIEWKCNYNANYMDQIMVNTMISSGTYAYDVFKHKNNIEITINTHINGILNESKTYKAILVETNNSSASVTSNQPREKLDMVGLVKATFQLVEQEMELIRTIKTSGVYKGVTIKSLLTSVFTEYIGKVKIRNKTLTPTINIVTPDNVKNYPHIIVPTGTSLVDLPTFLQDTNYGIYKGDIGVYFRTIRTAVDKHNLNVFVYPLYTTDKTFKQEGIFYYSPTQMAEYNDRNHILEDDIYKIVVGNVETAEVKENILMDKGGSITRNDPDSLLMYNSNVSGDNVTYDNKNNVGAVAYHTEDKLVNERYVGNEVNMFKHVSGVISESLDIVKIVWKFSNHSMLKPGMMFTLYYQRDDKIKKMRGTIVEYVTLYRVIGKIEETHILLKMGAV